MMNAMNRRTFLRTSAQLATVAALAPVAKAAPSERLNIAGIGIGGMGKMNLRNMASENIVALCDVDHAFAAPVFAEYPNAKTYTDYRVMLEKQPEIDAVLIATPDHSHAVIASDVLDAGKHIYCQKPLTHGVGEARFLAEKAKGLDVVTQMGIQGHASGDAREVCEWIWSGAIGPVREVIAWCSLSYYPWGHEGWSSPCGVRPAQTPTVPETLDWDLWLGPAAARPYHPCYHPGVWRSWWDFGSGMVCDRGVHTLDPVFWALKLGAPEHVEATVTDLNPETHPVSSIVRYEFGAREDMPPVVLTWYDGIQPPRHPAVPSPALMSDGDGGGVLFIGDEGVLNCGTYGNSPTIFPEEKRNDLKAPPQMLPRLDSSHEMEWVEACKAGRPAGAHFGYSGPLTEMVQLGNIAKRLPGRPLAWDDKEMIFTNSEKATALVHKEYREGWTL